MITHSSDFSIRSQHCRRCLSSPFRCEMSCQRSEGSKTLDRDHLGVAHASHRCYTGRCRSAAKQLDFIYFFFAGSRPSPPTSRSVAWAAERAAARVPGRAPFLIPIRQETETTTRLRVPRSAMRGGRYGRRIDLARHHRRDPGAERPRLPVRLLGEGARQAALRRQHPGEKRRPRLPFSFGTSDGVRGRGSSSDGEACPAVLSLSPVRRPVIPVRPCFAFARSNRATRRGDRR